MKSSNGTNLLCSVDTGGIKFEAFWPGSAPRVPARSRAVSDPDAMRGIHTHFTYEAFFVTDGRLRLVTEHGETAYGRALVIVPPGLGHYSVPEGECFCLLFSFAGGSVAGARLRQCLADRINVLSLGEDLAFYIKRLAVQSGLESAAAARDTELLTALILNGIMAQLLPLGIESTGGRTASHIGDIEKYINNHILERITLRDVAEGVYLSSRQAARIIKRTYGRSFSEVLAVKRLTAAEMLLKNTDRRISEIAESTFVGSKAYFYVLFKQKYGMSPLQYRKQWRRA